MQDSVDIHRVVGAIYDAAGEPEAWPRALEAVTAAFGVADTHVFLFDDSRGGTSLNQMSGRHSPEIIHQYQAYYAGIDPRLAIAARLPVGSIFSDHEHFDADFVRTSEYYNDFLLKNGVQFATVARLVEGEGRHGGAALVSRPQTGPVPASVMPLVATVFDHLGRAMRLQTRLSEILAQRDALAAGLDSLAFGFLLVAETGVVVYANRQAQSALRGGDGIGVRQGRPHAGLIEEDARLRRMVEAALATARGQPAPAAPAALRITRPSGLPPWNVMVGPVRPGQALPDGLAGAPHAILLLVDPATRPRVAAETLSALYGLSPREAELALGLAGGDGIDDIAGRRGVSVATLHTQRKSIYAKMDVSRQTDFVRRVLALDLLDR